MILYAHITGQDKRESSTLLSCRTGFEGKEHIDRWISYRDYEIKSTVWQSMLQITI